MPWQSCLQGYQVTCLFYCSRILSLISKVILLFWLISGVAFCLVKYLPESSIVILVIQKGVSVQGVWPTLWCFWILLGLTGTHVTFSPCSPDLSEQNTEQVQKQPPSMCFHLPWKSLGEVFWTGVLRVLKIHQSPFNHLKSHGLKWFYSELIRGCCLLRVSPVPWETHLFSVELLIFEELLSSEADISEIVWLTSKTLNGVSFSLFALQVWPFCI